MFIYISIYILTEFLLAHGDADQRDALHRLATQHAVLAQKKQENVKREVDALGAISIGLTMLSFMSLGSFIFSDGMTSSYKKT